MPKRLSQQIIIYLTIIVVIVSAVSGYFRLKSEEREILRIMVNGADQVSMGIVSATRYAMLTGDQAYAFMTIRTIASNKGVERVRVFDKDGMVAFSTKSGGERRVDKDGGSCTACHSSPQPRVNIDVWSRSRIVPASDGSRRLSMITPIYNEPSCSNATCHIHQQSTKVLGILEVAFDLTPLDNEIAATRNEVIVVTVIRILLIGLFIVLFTRRFVDKPIKQLIAGTHAVSEMRLDHVVEVSSSTELGELAHEFNLMSERLKKTMAELNKATQTLESKVRERTELLEIAHQKLLQTDRLASLGQLSATVAHEINNPISGVLNLAMLLNRIMKDDGIPPGRISEFRKFLGQIINETTRVGRIVSDLLAFSRKSKPQRANVNLNNVIQNTVGLLSHRLELGNIQPELHLADDLPLAECDYHQMQQVIINLVMNGAEACQSKGQGTLKIETRAEDSSKVIIEVSDTGDGIPKDIQSKIFDPFFTTKGDGKGVGLGLSVVYGIVQAHGGEIEVHSQVGFGTTFKVIIPTKRLATEERSGAPQGSSD